MDGAHLFMSVKRTMVCSMVENGGYLDFGSWVGECITDPDLCTNGLTISMWLRINANNINYNSEYQYIISSGAEGETMRGIVFLLKVGKLIHFWYFLVWYGTWYGMVHGMVWYMVYCMVHGMVWCMVWYMVWYGVIWCSMV